MISVKVNEKLKQEVSVIFQELGLTHDDAIRLFYEQVCVHKGLPFDIDEALNAETTAAIEDARHSKLKPKSLAEISAI